MGKKSGVKISFFDSYEKLEDEPSQEFIVCISREEFLKKLGIKDTSDHANCFIELEIVEIQDLDNEQER